MSQSLVHLLEGLAERVQHHLVEAPGHLPHRQLDVMDPGARRERAEHRIPSA
jgi:hypothetical protein